MVKGHLNYKGYTAQQHPDFYQVMKEFLIETKPSRILEIGTAGGGFILAIRDILDEIGLENVNIKTFDVYERNWYDDLRMKNIEINVENIFDYSYLNLIKPEKITPFIQSEGVTIVFCDGGHKKGEFNNIAPIIKKGDFILAHDYIKTKKIFEDEFKDKIWNWCEIEEKDIETISKIQNLESFNEKKFSKIVWICKTKK